MQYYNQFNKNYNNNQQKLQTIIILFTIIEIHQLLHHLLNTS